MLKLSRLILFAAVLLTFCTACSDCLAAETRRIAVLPIYNTSRNMPQTEAYLQNELDKNLHIPLNGTLKLAEFVPQNEILAAIASLPRQKPSAAFLQLVAEKLDADIAVCLVVNKAYEYVIPRFYETYLVSGLSLQLLVYDNKLLPMTHRYKASDSYYDTVSPSGSLTSLAENVSWKLFQEAQLKQTIFPLTSAGK